MSQRYPTCPTCGGRRLWCRVCHVRRCDCLPSRCGHAYKKFDTYWTWVTPEKLGAKVWCRTKGKQPKTGWRRGIILMSLAKAKRRMGNRKGGETTQARGKAYHWTKESAAKAARKRWKKVKRSKRLGGIALGLKLKRRKAIDRKALREYYSIHVVHGIHYYPERNEWTVDWFAGPGSQPRVLSERAALIRLGHLPSTTQYTPDEILRKPLGTRSAEKTVNTAE